MKGKFKPHDFDSKQADLSRSIREIASVMDEALDNINMCREAALAKTKLEECVMWANKAIALGGTK